MKLKVLKPTSVCARILDNAAGAIALEEFVGSGVHRELVAPAVDAYRRRQHHVRLD